MTSTSDSVALTLETPALLATSRCTFTSLSGRRCRMSTQPDSTFCLAHSDLCLDDPDSINLAPLILGKIKRIESTADVQEILGNLFVLLSQNRISTRRAAVLTYMLQQLTRTLSAIHREIRDEVPQIIVDTPSPVRD